jgi:hypothetical protein
MSRLFSRATVSGASLTGANMKAMLTALWDAMNSGGFSDASRTTVTTSSTLTTTQCGLLLVDATAGSIVLTLPASGTPADDAFYNLRRIDSTLNTVTVQRAGTDTLEGGVNITLPPNSTTEMQLPSGSANWRVFGIGGPTPAATRAALGVTDFGGNRLINGAGNINQLALVSPVTLVAGAYGHDGFKAGAGGCTYSFATAGNVTTFTITAGTLIQVADGRYLRSENHVLSWSGTAQGKIGAGAYSASGVSAFFVGGSNATMEWNAGTLSLTQLEPGTVPTPFEFRRDELRRCEEYYEVGEAFVAGAYPTGSSGAISGVSCVFKTPKASVPGLQQLAASTVTNVSGTAFGVATTKQCPVNATIGAAAGTYSATIAWAAVARL